MPATAAIVTKAEFARLCSLTRGRVSQMIGEGMIGADCLVGEGPKARIDVAKARRAIAKRRDAGQATGNGLGTRLRDAPPTPATTTALGKGALAASTAADLFEDAEVEERIKREKLVELQRRNRQGADEEAARQGYYTSATEARREMARVAEQMLRAFDGAVTDMATAVAARFEVEQRDVLHLMRDEFRRCRAKAAKAATASAEALPALVEVEAPVRVGSA